MQPVYQKTLVTSMVDGPTLTAAAAAQCIPPAAKITLPNNFFDLGSVLHIVATGRISSVITTPGTARFDVRIGGVIVFDSLAILLATAAARTNVGWVLDIFLTCRVIGGTGATSQLFGQGTWQSSDIIGNPLDVAGPAGSVLLPFNSAPALGTVFDNTLANTLDLFFTQTVATGSMTVHQYKVGALRY